MNRQMYLHQRGFLLLMWLSALLLFLFIRVPSAGAAPGVHWEQTYGGQGYDEALAVVETKEGDLVFSGFIGNPTTSNQSVYLVKTDHAGNLLWENSFDGALAGGCYECVGASIDQTSDDGFIIAGSTKTVMESNDKIYLIKTDATGNREWEKIMDLEAQGFDYTKRRAYAVKEVPDLGFIIAGSIQQNQQTEAALVKTDRFGNVEWVQLFGNQGWDMFRSVEVTSDQGYVAAGHTEVDSQRYLYITKTDDDGHQVWAYVADRPNSQAREVYQTGDGGYIAAGYYGSNLYLLKLDGEGNKQWERSLGMPGGNFGYSLDLTNDGGFILVGSNSQGIYVAKTDGKGVLDWEKSFGKEATAYAIRQTSDGGYVMAGGKASDAYLLKIQQAETAYLGVSSPNVLDNGTVLVYATVMDKSGGRNYSGNADVKIKITGIEEKVELGDRGVSGDFTAGDGVYSAWQKIIGPGPVSIELFLNDLKIDELEIKVINDPELIVLSNLEPLYREFTETGMASGDDNNANDIPDFYDLLDRINQYASDHHGILFDLNQEIAGYQAKSYDSDAKKMCLDIKKLVHDISNIHPFKYVAIVGDDEVVPMFRRYDGTNQEVGYPVKLGGDFGNRTLKDSALGYIMTDGEAIKKAYRDYWMNTNPRWAGDPHSAYSAYGTVYYGLPTRPLQHSANLRHAAQALELSEREEENDGQIFRASLQASASETMSITVDVPELKVTQDEKGAILFEVPNDGTFVSQPFAPALPLVSRSFLLPQGTTVNDVILAEQNSALYPEKVSLQVPPVINATLGELKGSFEVPNPYPERIFWWNTFETDGGVMLNISIVPVQYNPETDEATLYSHLKFSASLSTPLSATTFGSVIVNRGNPLEVNQAGLPIDLTINSPVDQDAILSFSIRDRSGNILGSGRKSLSLISGVTPSSLEFNTMNWSPGPRDFTIALTGDTVLATWNQTLDTAGIYLESNLEQRIYSPAESSALLDIEVRNEQGIGMDNLEQDNFDLLLNGNQLAITSLENKGAGRYQLPISLEGLGEGFFRLDLTVRDRRGMQNSDRNYFAIQADTETPVVKKTVPKKDATGVDLEQVISLTFSEDIVESTAFADISIKTAEETVSYTAQISGSTLTLTPASNLEPGSIYTVTIPKGAIKDLTGNDIAWDYHFKFVTYAGPDTVPPVYASNSPLEGTVDFPATARISIGFSESVAAGPVFADIILQADDNPVAFTTTINGAQLMLIPSLPLPYGSRCQVTIPAGAFQDQVGNLLEAPFSLTFTVETGPDSAPPQIVETIPVHDGQGVVPDALVNIVFNEPIQAGSDFDNITWMAGDAAVGFATDMQGQTLTLTASNPLPFSTACTVTVPAAAVMDLSENQLVSGDTFTFTTGDLPDTCSPQITRTIPADEGQGVLLGAPVLIYFDEAIQESARFAEILWQTAGKNITFTPVIDGRILTLTPQENLDYSLSYTVTIPADAVKDLAGNALANSDSLTFTTGDSPDTIPPAIAQTSPARDEEGVLTDALIYVVFDEAVQASAAFNTIKVESGETPIGYSAVINGKTLTITPDNILNLNTVYQVTIPAGAVKDLSGNDLAGELLYSFTTMAELQEDTTPPTMSASLPTNNASDIPVNQTIILTFNEPIIQGTSFGTIALQAGEVEVFLNATISRNTLTITPAINLAYSATYVLTVPAGAVKDLTGNALADGLSLTFTTEASPSGGGGGGSPPSTGGGQPAGNVIKGEDVQQAQGNAYSRDITASQTTHTVLVENSALSQILQTGRSIIIAFSGAKIILTPQQGQGFLSQDPNSNLNIFFTHLGTQLSFQGNLTAVGGGVEINLTHGQDSTGELTPGSLTLILPYQQGLVQDSRKLGIYKLVDGQWQYVGGIVNSENGTIQTTINSPGQYMVFENHRTFPDIANHWAQNDIEILASRFIVNGLLNSNFAPQNPVTRAELTAMLANILRFTQQDLPSASARRFNDISDDDWFADALRQATAAGLLDGYPDGTIRPYAIVTREEAAVIIMRLAELLQITSPPTDTDPLSMFSDSGDLSNWAREFMARVVSLRIFQGNTDQQLRPTAQLIRAEMTSLLMRTLEKGGYI